MDRHTILFTTDKRQRHLGELLFGKKHTCSFEECMRESKQLFENTIGKVQKIYVFPTPVSKLSKEPKLVQKIKDELEKESLLMQWGCKRQEPSIVFGGAFTSDWLEFFEINHISYVDFMKLEDVVEGNAQITAEGVIAEVLNVSPFSIEGQNVIVTGYGHCAKPIAKKLKTLGANVIVVARKELARQEAEKEGYEVADFVKVQEFAKDCTTLINTVPALVITEEILKKLSKDAVVIDIASKPGGVDFASAKELGIFAKLALGLPAVYTTKSSAKLFEKVISECALLKEYEREDKAWIFQIII